MISLDDEVLKRLESIEKQNKDVQEDEIKKEKEMLSTLQRKEGYALILRFGLLGSKKSTFDKVGSLLEVTRERASQIVAKALRKLRHPTRIEKVRRLSHKELREAVCGKSEDD